MKIFDSEKLMSLAEANSKTYQQTKPFPHIVLDDFIDPALLEQALDIFPTPEQLEFYRYDNVLEKKLAFDQVVHLPQPISSILLAMNQPIFLCFLEKLTGIKGLIPDPYYRGGGIHQIEPGGKLDVHIDFNKYKTLNLDRRLNVLLYLNKDWLEEYGGYFEIWQGEHFGHNKHKLNKCVNKILPIFNRLVVFSTSEKSYHGHPEPLNCPEGWTRKSIATYYYTVGRPVDEDVPAHSTIFLKRPQDEDNEEVENLRRKRNEGRLSSNVSSAFVADK